MAEINGREALLAADYEVARTSRPSAADIKELPFLVSLLKLIEPYVRKADIVLKDGETISVNEKWAVPTQFHCEGKKEPCAEVDTVESPSGEIFGLCRVLVRSPQYAKQLVSIESNRRKVTGTQDRKLLLDPDDREITAARRQSLVDTLESIRYQYTRRINELKAQNGKKRTKRPILEQRKVGDYLYILQPAQKGGSYWYLHFRQNGKRSQTYLGKERPSFDPERDLAEKLLVKAKKSAR